MGMNRLPPPTSGFVQFSASTPQTPAVAPVPAAPSLQREEPASTHGHVGHEGAPHGHATPHATGHGPTPRPRGTAKSSKTKRRKKASGTASSEDGDLDMPEMGEHGTGVAAVAFDGSQRDGSDDDAEGGEDRSRQDRLARVRHFSDDAASGAGTANFARLPRLHGGTQARLALERFVQRACDAAAQGAPDMGLQLKRLKLQLLREMPGVHRLDRGGLARVKQLLGTCMPSSRARAGRPADPESVTRIANGNLMLVMHLLQLQAPTTPAQRAQSIARLAVQTHGD